jgi:protein-tyrosine phosphatase
MGEILFICTGNYYRSRLAEILFNHYASQEELPLRAYSKGLEAYIKRNTGPISPHTLSYLDSVRIPWPEVVREPVQLLEEDFGKYRALIFMDESEHRPMVDHYFPGYTDKVHFWKVQDVQFVDPEDALPELAEKVMLLVKDLKQNYTSVSLEAGFISAIAENINEVKHYQ